MFRRIRELREEKNLSQAQMANLLFCSQQTYNDYELGSQEILMDILVCLIEIHNVSADYLLGRTDKRKNKAGG